MNTNNNTNKRNKPLAILLCVGFLAGLIYLSNLNRNKAEEFSKAVEKRFNVRIPSELNTKAAKVKWFCETYNLSPEGCNDLSSIESRMITGDFWDSEGFDIKAFEHRMQEAKGDVRCTRHKPEAIENKFKKRRASHIEVSLFSKDDSDRYMIHGGNIISSRWTNPLCPE